MKILEPIAIEATQDHIEKSLTGFHATPFALALKDKINLQYTFPIEERYGRIHLMHTKFNRERKSEEFLLEANFLTKRELNGAFFKFISAYERIREKESPEIEDILEMGDAYKMIEDVRPFEFRVRITKCKDLKVLEKFSV